MLLLLINFVVELYIYYYIYGCNCNLILDIWKLMIGYLGQIWPINQIGY